MAEAGEKSSLLTRSELFAGLPSSACTHILSRARPMDFPCSQVMYFAGDQIEQVFLLTDGRVKITQFSERGTEVILRLCIPGEVISELALVPGSKQSWIARCLPGTQRPSRLLWNVSQSFYATQRASLNSVFKSLKGDFAKFPLKRSRHVWLMVWFVCLINY